MTETPSDDVPESLAVIQTIKETLTTPSKRQQRKDNYDRKQRN